MSRPNRQGFSLNKLPGCNDTYDATYQSYRHTKFPNSRHGAPLSDPIVRGSYQKNCYMSPN